MTSTRLDIPVDLSPLLEALRQPLDFVDNAERRGEIERFLENSRHHLDHAAFQMLSTIASQISAGPAGMVARVELRPDGAHLVLEGKEEPEEPAERVFDGDHERVTLRIPAELKEMIDRLANLQGVSANSVYIRELARTLARRARQAVREEFHEAAREAGEQHRTNQRARSMKGFVGYD
jgi:hypothetical protein